MYDRIGFTFDHRVYGDYNVGLVTASVDQRGFGYSMSYDKDVYVIDPSVVDVVTVGWFNMLFPVVNIPARHTVKLNVGIYGSGDYRVTKAEFN